MPDAPERSAGAGGRRESMDGSVAGSEPGLGTQESAGDTPRQGRRAQSTVGSPGESAALASPSALGGTPAAGSAVGESPTALPGVPATADSWGSDAVWAAAGPHPWMGGEHTIADAGGCVTATFRDGAWALALGGDMLEKLRAMAASAVPASPADSLDAVFEVGEGDGTSSVNDVAPTVAAQQMLAALDRDVNERLAGEARGRAAGVVGVPRMVLSQMQGEAAASGAVVREGGLLPRELSDASSSDSDEELPKLQVFVPAPGDVETQAAVGAEFHQWLGGMNSAF